MVAEDDVDDEYPAPVKIKQEPAVEASKSRASIPTQKGASADQDTSKQSDSEKYASVLISTFYSANFFVSKQCLRCRQRKYLTHVEF